MMMMINRTAAQTTRRRRGPADRYIEININKIYIVILLSLYDISRAILAAIAAAEYYIS